MPDISTVLLYVADPPASARFYAALLGHEPVEIHPTFAMLPMAPGVMLGLWRRDGVLPTASAPCGCGELAIAVADAAAVRALHADWAGCGIAILQEPVQMDFGFTCTAADPDGNRLRVMALA